MILQGLKRFKKPLSSVVLLQMEEIKPDTRIPSSGGGVKRDIYSLRQGELMENPRCDLIDF